MAPNPSAALSVFLAGLLALGPVPAALASPQAAPVTPRPAGVPSAGPGAQIAFDGSISNKYVGLQVPASINKYGVVLADKDALGKLKPGQEAELDVLVIDSMKDDYDWHHPFTHVTPSHTVQAHSARARVKMLDGGRIGASHYQLALGGQPITVSDCNLNGDARCFNQIVRIPRHVTVYLAQGPATPPPPPGPQPGGQHPGGTQPGGQHPGGQHPGGATADVPWRSVPLNEGHQHAAHVKCKKDECTCAQGACKGKRIALFRLVSGQKTATDLKLKAEAAKDFFLNYKAGKYNICKVENVKVGPPQAPVRSFAEDGFGADAAYSLKGAESQSKSTTGLKVSVDWTGTVPAKQDGTMVDAACEPEPADGQTDPLDAKLDELFTNKVERVGADFVAKTFGGKTGAEARAAFLAALSGPDKDKTITQARTAIQKEVAVHVEKKSSGLSEFMQKRGVTDQDVLKYLCDLLPKGDGQAAPTTPGATGAREQLGVTNTLSQRARTGDDATARGTDMVNRDAPPAQGQAPALPFEVTDTMRQQCAILNSQQPAPSGPGTSAPPPTPSIANGCQQGPDGKCKPDKDTDSGKKDDDAKKKKDLQRMVIGGMGGAIVLGVFGFIFGGPIGAIAMASIGFGVMAGVTYMNNNPIDK